MVAHVNRLKEWHTPEAFVMRVVVADEESESLDTPGRVALSKPRLTSAQDKTDRILAEQVYRCHMFRSGRGPNCQTLD